MLFMGEEYAEKAPFLYFVSHGDKDLIRAVREGRKKEFGSFEWDIEPPDPQSEDTFKKSMLNWDLPGKGDHNAMLNLYAFLIKLRNNHLALNNCDRNKLYIEGDEKTKLVHLKRKYAGGDIYAIMNFSNNEIEIDNIGGGIDYKKVLDTSDNKWAGPGGNVPEKIESTKNITFNPLSAVILDGSYPDE